jgi:hypothetical protein
VTKVIRNKVHRSRQSFTSPRSASGMKLRRQQSLANFETTDPAEFRNRARPRCAKPGDKIAEDQNEKGQARVHFPKWMVKLSSPPFRPGRVSAQDFYLGSICSAFPQGDTTQRDTTKDRYRCLQTAILLYSSALFRAGLEPHRGRGPAEHESAHGKQLCALGSCPSGFATHANQ